MGGGVLGFSGGGAGLLIGVQGRRSSSGPSGKAVLIGRLTVFHRAASQLEVEDDPL
jgi:hypothetical protein